jgi:hypothetical protein
MTSVSMMQLGFGESLRQILTVQLVIIEADEED